MDPGDVRTLRATVAPDDAGCEGLTLESGRISTESLLILSRGPLKHFVTKESGDDHSYVQKVRKLWLALLATMHDASKTNQHTTAVCNAVCVFIQSARSSPTAPIRSFVMSAETWVAMFDALLANFDNGKLKPLRQVLKTLTKILAQQEDRARAHSIEDDILSRMASIIMLGRPDSHFKASIVIFEAFLRSNISILRVLAAIGRCYGENLHHWTHRLKTIGFNPSDVTNALSEYPMDDSVCHFTFALVLAVANSDAQATAGTFAISFVSTLDEYNLSLGSLWSLHTAYILRQIPAAIEPFKYYLLVPLFKSQEYQYHDLLDMITNNTKDALTLQHALAVVIIGRQAGLLSNSDVRQSLHHMSEAIRPASGEDFAEKLESDSSTFFTELLEHSSIAVRIRAYDLLANSDGLQKLRESSTFPLLSRYFTHLQGDSDPNYRGQINGITKTIIQKIVQESRFRAHASTELNTASEQNREHKDDSVQYEQFVCRFVDFLEDELGPNCSFPRHISALRAIEALLDTCIESLSSRDGHVKRQGQSPCLRLWSTIFSNLYNSPHLWRLLLDPFEEVRAVAASNLTSLGSSEKVTGCLGVVIGGQGQKYTANAHGQMKVEAHQKSHTYSVPKISILLKGANRLASLTNRADHADAVGHLLALQSMYGYQRVFTVDDIVGQLQGELGHLSDTVSLPEKGISLHGYLIGLRYIIETLSFSEHVDLGLVLTGTVVSMAQLLELCRVVWITVRNGLCVDSPEFSRDLVATGPLEGPKDYLAYSWRALRDSSLLIQSIIARLALGKDGCASREGRICHLRTIYVLCFDQLTALRHRGAFSTVAQTFALCCEHLIKNSSLRTEVKGWYEEVLQILEDQSSNLTRRSAGIPAISSGILLASPLTDFNHAITTLILMARPPKSSSRPDFEAEYPRLPEVHALNCLREMFNDSRFRDRTMPWLIDVLDLAATSLNCKIWAIRNCGLMLFRTCVTRIGIPCSADEPGSCEVSGQDQAGTMLTIAINLMKVDQSAEFDVSELVFVGLDLVSRIHVPKADQERTREAILPHIGSRIWLIREHAARVYACQQPGREALAAATDLVSAITVEDQNKCHGILLCVQQLAERYRAAQAESIPTTVSAFAQAIRGKANEIQDHGAPIVQSGFAQIVTRSGSLCNVKVFEKSTPFRQQSPSPSQHLETRKASAARARLRMPSESHLQTTEALDACMSVLRGESLRSTSLVQIFQDIAAYDLNSASEVLCKLKEERPNGRYTRLLLIELYSDTIRRNLAEDIAATALSGLSICIDEVLEDGKDLTELQGTEKLLDDILRLSPYASRDVFNARLRAMGSLLSYTSTTTKSEATCLFRRELTMWIKMMKAAATDLTEAWTRLSAAKSLQAFRYGLTRKIPDAQKIALFSILYDLLNDDDEEIRDIAAATASFILMKTSSRIRLPLSALAACYRFPSYMVDMYSGEHAFQSMVLSRVILPTGIETGIIEEFVALALRNSAQIQLGLASCVSFDLFEEERQNLYLDDFREVTIWSSTLKSLNPKHIDEGLRTSARDWAVEGLQEICTALPRLSNGPFDVLSKVEVVALFLKVFEVAFLSLQWDDISSLPNTYQPKSPVRTGIEQLLPITRKFPLHPRARRVFEDGLERSQLEPDDSATYKESP